MTGLSAGPPQAGPHPRGGSASVPAGRGANIRLGVIADDFTGATDVANNLVRAGLRVVQTIGVPTAPVNEVDAVVVALKSRTAAVSDAWTGVRLTAQGPRR